MTSPAMGPTLSFNIEGSPFTMHPTVISPVPDDSPITVYIDGRIISFVAAGKPFFLYVMPDIEVAVVDLNETDWFSLGVFTSFEAPLTPYEEVTIIGPEARPEQGYTYNLLASDWETGLGLQYPLTKYKRLAGTSILFFDNEEAPRILRGPLHTDVKNADRAYPGGYTHTIPYDDAVQIGIYGQHSWMSLVVPNE